MEEIIILGINPQPWAVGTTYTGRSKGNIRSGLAPNNTLVAYQNAIKEEMGFREITPFTEFDRIMFRFYFWRRIESWDGGKNKIADATNLQKALEDAFQGILWPNDQQNIQVCSTIMDQREETEPAILIQAELFFMSYSERNRLNSVIELEYSRFQL
jgi:hypothetical protein